MRVKYKQIIIVLLLIIVALQGYHQLTAHKEYIDSCKIKDTTYSSMSVPSASWNNSALVKEEYRVTTPEGTGRTTTRTGGRESERTFRSIQ